MHDPSLLSVMVFLLFAESLCFGAFCILCLFSLWVLVYRQRRHRHSTLSFSLAAVVTSLFLLSGLYLAIDVRILKRAYVEHSRTPDGPSDFLQQETDDPTRKVHPLIFAIMTFLGDGFMVSDPLFPSRATLGPGPANLPVLDLQTYRIYIVWDRQLVSLIIPVLLLAGDFVAAAFATKALTDGPRTYYPILAPNASVELVAYFGMTLLTNVVTTLLLIGRLWWSDNRVKRYRSGEASTSVPWQVMKTIIQSQFAYSLVVVLNVVAYAVRSNLAVLTTAILPSLLGISFTLIITRIGISEMVGEASQTYPTQSSELSEHGRTVAVSPIAVNVFIARTDDRQDAGARYDKTVPGAGERVGEARG
ncbi:hypothetical protein VTO73DRAFT_4198 [Trametes versicolor]